MHRKTRQTFPKGFYRMNAEFVMGGSGVDMCDWITSRARDTSVETIMYVIKTITLKQKKIVCILTIKNDKL